MNDLIQFADVPVDQLQQVYRQREKSNIVTTAHAVLGGRASPPRMAKGLADLEVLSLKNTKVTQAGVDRLKKVLPDVLVLH